MARGSRRLKGRFRPTFTPDAPRRTLSAYERDFKASLDATGLVPIAVSTGLADLSLTLDSSDIHSERGPSLFAIATALKTAIDCVADPYPLAFPLPKRDAAALQAALHADGVDPDDFVTTKPNTPERVASAVRFATWLLAENHAYQAPILNRVANTLVILGLKGFQRLEALPEKTDHLFREAVGITGYDYILTLFGLWAKARVDSLIDLPTFLPLQARDPDRREHLLAAVEELSLRFDKYRDADVFPVAQTYTGKGRACALFSRWPLIRLNETQFMSAGHPFLKIQIGTKTLTKVLAFARKKEERPSTDYSTWAGHRLELFFGELCELWRPGEHFAEYEYMKQGNERSADRILFEQHGSSTVCCLFQLKLKMLSDASHFGASSEAMQKDLASSFSETIYKTIRFLVRASEAAKEGGLRYESADLTRQILSADRFCLIGIVPEMPSVFVFRDLRQQLLAEVLDHLRPAEREWFDRNSARCVWHVMDLDEFEFFLGLPADERHFYKRLTGYFRHAGVNGPLTNGGTLPSNFRSYLINKYGERNAEAGSPRLFAPVPDLLAIYEGMVEDVKGHFGLNPATP